MWIHKLRKKKLQFTLIGVILFFASAIFSACLIFTVETSNYAADYYSKKNSPDLFVNISRGAPAKQLLAQARSNKDFTHIATLDGRNVADKLMSGGRDITPGFFSFYALPDYRSVSWKITPQTGTMNKKGPAAGEIWVPGVFADQKGIRTGDKITLQGASNRTLTVSEIINDATCPSSMFGIYPFYVSQATLSSLKGGKPTVLLAINSKTDYSSAETWLHNLPPSITNALSGTFNVSQLLLSFTMFTLILGSIGMLSAILIFVVSIVIIRFLIKNNLIKEYRSIGIYKAMGFTNGQIAGFYLKCYALVGAVGLTLGSAAGLPLGYAVGITITRYIGGFQLSFMSVLLSSGGAAALFILLLLSVWHAHRRIRRITPVQALQIGLSSSPKKLRRSVLPHAFSPLATAINDVCKHRSYSVMFVLILTVSFYLSTFFISINYTVDHIAENSDIWFGIPRAEYYVSGNLTPEKIAAIQHDPAVLNSVYGSPLTPASIKTEKNSYGANFNDSSVISWNHLSDRNFFNASKIGRPPKYANEIAVSSGSIKGSSLSVGDYVTLTIGNSKKSYLVTGIYDNMMHASKTIEMSNQSLKETGLPYRPGMVAVKLKSGADYAAFAARMKHDLGLTADRTPKDVQDSITGVEEIMNPVTIMLVAVFITFSLLNILNLLLTTQLDNRRKFGILKAMGFTTAYISMQNLFKTLLLSLLSAAFAVALHLTLSPLMFYSMMGIPALVNSPQELIILIGSIFAGILALTLLFCIPLRKISPVELMEE
ncbi:ABC transporter permease [Sporolactobacillus putidus]|uniref:ABC3 transporter permease C-terminal domain-containing protein n=1 Tax=Sporolactobacillus putidus TaxID=492735 RepID=A0A917W1J6_9BACL|nr:ABC transporter permease [Sporolactobacillus putidus]GGL51006.1 hypothetical protein GCM10007968_14070 [Sporolactobacillus putidus]